MLSNQTLDSKTSSCALWKDGLVEFISCLLEESKRENNFQEIGELVDPVETEKTRTEITRWRYECCVDITSTVRAATYELLKEAKLLRKELLKFAVLVVGLTEKEDEFEGEDSSSEHDIANDIVEGWCSPLIGGLLCLHIAAVLNEEKSKEYLQQVANSEKLRIHLCSKVCVTEIIRNTLIATANDEDTEFEYHNIADNILIPAARAILGDGHEIFFRYATIYFVLPHVPAKEHDKAKELLLGQGKDVANYFIDIETKQTLLHALCMKKNAASGIFAAAFLLEIGYSEYILDSKGRTPHNLAAMFAPTIFGYFTHRSINRSTRRLLGINSKEHTEQLIKEQSYFNRLQSVVDEMISSERKRQKLNTAFAKYLGCFTPPEDPRTEIREESNNVEQKDADADDHGSNHSRNDIGNIYRNENGYLNDEAVPQNEPVNSSDEENVYISSDDASAKSLDEVSSSRISKSSEISKAQSFNGAKSDAEQDDDEKTQTNKNGNSNCNFSNEAANDEKTPRNECTESSDEEDMSNSSDEMNKAQSFNGSKSDAEEEQNEKIQTNKNGKSNCNFSNKAMNDETTPQNECSESSDEDDMSKSSDKDDISISKAQPFNGSKLDAEEDDSEKIQTNRNGKSNCDFPNEAANDETTHQDDCTESSDEDDMSTSSDEDDISESSDEDHLSKSSDEAKALDMIASPRTSSSSPITKDQSMQEELKTESDDNDKIKKRENIANPDATTNELISKVNKNTDSETADEKEDCSPLDKSNQG